MTRPEDRREDRAEFARIVAGPLLPWQAEILRRLEDLKPGAVVIQSPLRDPGKARRP